MLFGNLPKAWADSAPMTAVGVGLTPIPGGVPPIRMVREVVDIELYPNFAVVDASFELFNRGPNVRLDIGFPCLQAPTEWFPPASPLFDFQVWVNDEAMSSGLRGVANQYFPEWHVWRQEFPSESTSRLRVRYWTPLFGYRLASLIPFFYVLRTGRFWEGSIGEAIIRIRGVGVPLSSIVAASPKPNVESDDALLSWRFLELEPDFDIQILISPLARAADFLGESFRSIPELCGDSTHIGARVCTGGRIDDGRPSILIDERTYDSNVKVPFRFQEGIDFESNTELRLDLRQAERREVVIPDLLVGALLVTGRLEKNWRGRILRVEVLTVLKRDPSAGFGETVLDWARDGDRFRAQPDWYYKPTERNINQWPIYSDEAQHFSADSAQSDPVPFLVFLLILFFLCLFSAPWKT